MRILALMLILSLNLVAQDQKDFHAYEIIIQTDKNTALSAWQVEVVYDKTKTKITAIEGGDKPFSNPADYDARGLTAGKIILASFSLKSKDSRREFKVAKIHLYGPKGDIPKIKLIVAADVKGKKIKAKALLRSVKKNE